MSQVTLQLPNVNIHDPAVAVGVVLVVAAILASIVVEVYARHYSAKQLKKFGEEATHLGKAATATLLTAVSAGFTLLGYLLVLASSNASVLSSLPFVGKHVLGVVGIAYVIYNLRLNKTYQTVATFLGKWSKENRAANAPVVAPTPEPIVASSDNLLS